MISAIYEGNNTEIDLINTPNLILSGYEGLDQPNSETVTTTNPNYRGTIYQRSQIQDRTISFTFAVYDVENTRYKLMQVFKSGEAGILKLKSDFREGQIKCYFEEMTFSKFNNPTTCTIFLRATNPYFEGIEEVIIELTNAINNFVLETYIDETEGIVLGEITNDHTTEINNESDIPLGLTIEIVATEIVINPIIYNITTNKYIGIQRAMVTGDKLIINTNFGKKSIIGEANGVQTNLINRMTKGSSFFDLVRGVNKIQASVIQSNPSNPDNTTGENMIVYIKYRDEYEAI